MTKPIIKALVAGMASVGLLAAVSMANPPEARAGGVSCPGVTYYALGGNGDPGSVNVPGVPLGHRVNIEYPANVLKGDESRQIAVDKLNEQARSYRMTCPEDRIEVIGYSLGASAGSLAVDEWQNDPVMNQNTAAKFYGNPRKPVNAEGWGGIETVGLPNLKGVYTWRGAREEGPIRVTEICNEERDITCSAPAPLHRNLIGAWGAFQGYLTGDHLY